MNTTSCTLAPLSTLQTQIKELNDSISQANREENTEQVARLQTQIAKLYQQMANQGDANAMGSLGYIHFMGQGVEQDHSQALQLFHRAVDGGDLSQMSMLSYMYANGFGTTRDTKLAHKWFRLLEDTYKSLDSAGKKNSDFSP